MQSQHHPRMAGAAAALLLAAALPVHAQLPRITNGQVTTETLTAPFTASFNRLTASLADVTWIGYTVPSPRREGMTCCFSAGGSYVSGTMSDGWHGRCPLEPRTAPAPASQSAGQAATPGGPVRLEGPEHAYVLFRVEAGRIERIRAFSEGCDLDAGGRPVIWLENVNAADSVALLASMVSAVARRDRTANGALSALAMHEAPEASTALIRLARDHAAPTVRGEAIFWLAQRAGEKAAPEIAARIADDPDTEVKRRAVFALSTLPKDESVPLLIRVARTHENPAVRRQAFFWLGQSKDPRALEFFAEILR